MKFTKLALLGFTTLLLSTTVRAQDHTYDYWGENYTVQSLLGVVQYENLKFNVEGTTKEIDLSLLPQLGAGWGTLPRGDRFQYGLECSFLMGFMADDISFISAGGSGLYVKISTSMWMFDLAGGPYANLFLDKNHKVRIYAAAGPLMTYANYRSRREDASLPEDTTDYESAFGIGVYARTGFEFRIYEAGMLGLGVRGSWANIDLSDVGGSSELTGLAAFVSFTAGL